MNLLILGVIMRASGRRALSSKLPDLIKSNKIDFVIVNGENASDDGRGITQKILDEFFKMIIPEIETYINEKDITLVFDKKNLFIANKKNNITDEIVRIIDEKLK